MLGLAPGLPPSVTLPQCGTMTLPSSPARPPKHTRSSALFTFLSLFNFGKFATEVRPTLIVLKNSSSSNSSVRPSILPSFDRQLSRTSSFTWKGKEGVNQLGEESGPRPGSGEGRRQARKHRSTSAHPDLSAFTNAGGI